MVSPSSNLIQNPVNDGNVEPKSRSVSPPKGLTTEHTR
jgi:hypothetical protein